MTTRTAVGRGVTALFMGLFTVGPYIKQRSKLLGKGREGPLCMMKDAALSSLINLKFSSFEIRLYYDVYERLHSEGAGYNNFLYFLLIKKIINFL